ncbi:hypothetical protein [Leptospira paudalimensis]|uniref:NurA domain-containing protein n=1 Tax=Leptospira paudalimensis TaxID=2950024 RepID=A0ABT3MCL3_9LEPT|nr:hypothetical protein [Leptospira paudalimensis]MCW7506118.1 hypothetical protein [Leptospira paudalimensis]
MPYQAGGNLPGENASKLGHMAVIQSPFVNDLLQSFYTTKREQMKEEFLEKWLPFEKDVEPLRIIFAVDGSLQIVKNEINPDKELAFIKTALVKLDTPKLEEIDPLYPHPFALRDIMKDAGVFHATVLPLQNVQFKEISFYDGVRKIIFDSFKDPSSEGQVMETLRWLCYEKWDGTLKKSPHFNCPHCDRESEGLPYDQEIGNCEHCGGEVYLTDTLSFHLEMQEDLDYAAQSLATSYMQVHETIMLFVGIRYIWETKDHSLFQKTLFIKDGPLSLRAQYVKLVDPIRRFLEYAKQKNVTIHLIGQEKSGAFFDHLKYIQRDIPEFHFFLPNFDYIRDEIQHRPKGQYEYGEKTNYGNKVFVKLSRGQFLVLNVPTGHYRDTEDENSLIGFRKILGSILKILSFRHEGALMPVEIAHNVASLSNYPSARMLKLFSDERVVVH